MDSWGVFFLGVIAFSAVVQVAFLVGLLVFGRKLARRLDDLQARLDRDLGPALANFTRVSRAAAEVADMATLQARRLDLVLGDTIERIGDTAATIQQLVSRPLKPIANLVALLKGVQRGVEVFLAFDREAPPHRRIPPRRRGAGRGEDDEHLFV
ncbi:MAG TPA: hypothetical protein VGB87_17510 [Vicinamibacteria bacterium]